MSHYCVIYAGDTLRQERTNIGVVVFDSKGLYFGHSVSVKRAIARGDLCADWTDDVASDYASEFKSVGDVIKRRDTTAHCMSTVQIDAPCGSTLNPDALLSSIYPRMVD